MAKRLHVDKNLETKCKTSLSNPIFYGPNLSIIRI